MTDSVDTDEWHEWHEKYPVTTEEWPQKPSPGELAAQSGLHFDQVVRGDTYRDKSTIMVVPAIAPIPPKVVSAWLSLQTPANQKFTRLLFENCEVADAYNQAVAVIQGSEEFSTWKWLLTVETDNIPPPTGLLRLIDDAEESGVDVIGGLYYMKGEGMPPLCYGRPEDIPKNFRPFEPPPRSIVPVNGLGMGFTLFRIEMFKKIPQPWFKTVQEWIPGVGTERYQTQDLYFFEKAAKYGFHFAVDTHVTVGHLDANGQIW